jgi:uncharacterized protein involved in exopolysaccharide biosynthesis
MNRKNIEAGELGLDDAVRIWATRWRTLAIALVLGVVFGIALWWIIPKSYRGDVVVVPATDSGRPAAGLSDRLTGLASLAGISIPAIGASSAENIAFLRSRFLAEQFVRERNLLPKLFPEKWDSAAEKWRKDDAEYVPSIAQGVERFVARLQIVEDKKAGTLRVSVVSKEPTLAATWANSFVLAANGELRQRAIRDADKTIAYLERPIDRPETSVQLRAALVRVLEDEVKVSALANARDEFAFKVIDPAVIPEPWQAASPGGSVMALGGGFLGLLVAASWLLIQTILRPRTVV